MFVIKYRAFFFGISAIAIAVSVLAIVIFGLNLGIDFKGGSVVELEYVGARPATATLQTSISTALGDEVVVQPIGDKGVIIRTRALSEIEKATIIAAAGGTSTASGVIEKRSNSIGPTIGEELAQRGLIAIAIVVVAIVLFVALAFWGVSRPVASWKYGLIAIVTLLHDIIIPTGVFAVLGHFRGTEVDALFLTALLTILGLSVNDTIVVFDRIRENLKNKIAPHFEDVVGISLSQTFTRSINTSLTVILVLLALLFFGSPTTRDFALVLTIGMVVGTYSSIFIASPLLVVWEKWSRK